MNNQSETTKSKVTVEVSTEEKELLDLMLKKASISYKDLFNTYTSLWVNQNLDLLTEAEKSKFKNQFYGRI